MNDPNALQKSEVAKLTAHQRELDFKKRAEKMTELLGSYEDPDRKELLDGVLRALKSGLTVAAG